ncbi:MAG: sulfurtransferase TusA family protein [Moraxella sp.]
MNCNHLLDSLPDNLTSEIAADLTAYLEQNPELKNGLMVSVFFDARGLACPMPLLKAKVSLRQVALGDSLYLLASDKNSQTDICAFCQKNQLKVTTWQSYLLDNAVYHFIITKAD